VQQQQFIPQFNIEHNKNGKVKANLPRTIPANKVQHHSGSEPDPLDVKKHPELKYCSGLIKHHEFDGSLEQHSLQFLVLSLQTNIFG